MKEKKAILLLFLASFIWGFAFIFQRMASGTIGPCYFNGIRMFIGFLVLIPLLTKSIKAHKGDVHYFKNLLIGGISCGLATAFPSILQQYAMEFTTAGKAGFLTSTYILFVPIFSVLTGKKVNKRVWICVFTGLIGAYLLSFQGNAAINKGDICILICAVLFAIQIMLIDHHVKKLDGPDLAALQFLFCSLTSLLFGVFTEDITMQQVEANIIPILYTGVLSSGIAYTLQIIGQKYVAPAKATFPLSLENAWAAVAGVIVLHEVMTGKELIGCLILFVSVIFSQF